MAAQLTIDHHRIEADPAEQPQQATLHALAPAIPQEVFGALINLSGKRRLTSQRVVLYAVLASLGHEGAQATARATLEQLREAHTTLVEGKGGLPGVFAGPLHEAYFGTLQGDAAVRGFIRLAERTLDVIAGDGIGAPALLDELVSSATPLLSILNGLTLVYEEQATRHAQARRRQLQQVLEQMDGVSRQVRQLAFNSQVLAARAGENGRDFAAVAASMTAVTGALDSLMQDAMGRVSAR
ncbi:MAG: methyl-accepting chemotaxis protein [Massilia sp.]